MNILHRKITFHSKLIDVPVIVSQFESVYLNTLEILSSALDYCSPREVLLKSGDRTTCAVGSCIKVHTNSYWICAQAMAGVFEKCMCCLKRIARSPSRGEIILTSLLGKANSCIYLAICNHSWHIQCILPLEQFFLAICRERGTADKFSAAKKLKIWILTSEESVVKLEYFTNYGNFSTASLC